MTKNEKNRLDKEREENERPNTYQNGEQVNDQTDENDREETE